MNADGEDIAGDGPEDEPDLDGSDYEEGNSFCEDDDNDDVKEEEDFDDEDSADDSTDGSDSNGVGNAIDSEGAEAEDLDIDSEHQTSAHEAVCVGDTDSEDQDVIDLVGSDDDTGPRCVKRACVRL